MAADRSAPFRHCLPFFPSNSFVFGDESERSQGRLEDCREGEEPESQLSAAAEKGTRSASRQPSEASGRSNTTLKPNRRLPCPDS